MFKGLIIEELLKERKILKKDMQRMCSMSPSVLDNIISKGNPTAASLEKIADFFDLPIDYFFKRNFFPTNPIGNISGVGHKIQNGQNNIMLENQEKEIEHLKTLIVEKEQMIKEKEQMIKEKERFIQLLMNK